MAVQPSVNNPYSIFRVNEPISGSSSWLIASGVATLILGLIALSASVATTFISVVFLGVVAFLAAIFQAVFAVTCGRWGGFALHLLLAVLYGITGIFLFSNPVMAATTLTLFLGFLFVTSGLFRIIASTAMQFSGWGWALFSGVVTTALGVWVVMNLPEASLVLLGVLLGVDLIFVGVNLMSFGIALRRGSPGATRPRAPARA